MSTRCASSRAPILGPFERIWHAVGRGHCRGNLVGRRSARKRNVALSLARLSIRFGEGGGQFDHRRARGMLNRCARESKREPGSF